ncbi:MAG: hypothetical protein A2864_02010 [Candidatus Woykebacteria bacterium RIFCSPHIGHO2_01_FULL_39_12]|uniref:UDP-N-acetylmuramate--L-alanine ligase n=1 Tax=Candidatus Woykebacteria bacterium RIFCSPHIGHO2_01_FULL_39_12 TaxID=1802599 RepID=A0A1G1WHZ3_9BACT|nr:MAG: hypothetical protein A2864_02010 [Candidatus Woykebacteria bacterium RIFCSPHIGHO2_01_FULL_39_12]
MGDKRIHFVGIGGSGASAAAEIAASSGWHISGCDINMESEYLTPTLKQNIKLGHSTEHINDIDVLVFSPAIISLDPENKEISQSRDKLIPTMTWQQFIGRHLLKDKFVIAVAGTHGKSTTAAMVGQILEYSGFDPTVVLGAKVIAWGKNHRVGKSVYFVIEADEYNNNFLNYHPSVVGVTSLEYDHPEFFKNFDQVKNSFEQFVAGMKENSTLILGPRVDLANTKGSTKKTTRLKNLRLKVIGRFNQTNAVVAAAVCREFGIGEEAIKSSLQKFEGIERRFEFKGEEKGVLVFDDYAHHPTAIKAILEAAREKFKENRIWVVFQPHLFSRVRVFFEDFAAALGSTDVDEVILLPVFAAREKDSGDVGSKQLATAIKGKKAKYLEDFESAATYLANRTVSRDVVLFLGAGDINKASQLLLKKLSNKA